MAIGAITKAATPTQKPHVHAHLSQSYDPIKGRQLHVTAPVSAGEILLTDTPYAVIPVVDDISDDILCSNPSCCRKTSTRVSCANNCLSDVVWCSDDCRDADTLRHGFECAWLKRHAVSLRSVEGEYAFGVLWLIVRVLAARYIEQLNPVTGTKNDRFSNGWTAMTELCDNRELWPQADLTYWRDLVGKYLDESLPETNLSADDILTLVCQQESNSFGLYPRETGRFPLPELAMDRGEQFGAAIYPRSSLANHSCCPNITHKPDNQGRMVFTASRDIAAGEECCISYFDLSKYVDVSRRQKHLNELFSFTCQCERCLAELPSEEEIWGALPFV